MLSPLCFEISVNNLVPQREACSLECVRQGRGGRSGGVCFCVGLCFLLSCGFSLKLSAAVTGRPGWAPPRSLCSEGRGCISSYKEETSRGGQDFLTLVCGSVPGLTPQEPTRRPCVLRKDLLSMPGGPLPWPTI